MGEGKAISAQRIDGIDLGAADGRIRALRIGSQQL